MVLRSSARRIGIFLPYAFLLFTFLLLSFRPVALRAQVDQNAVSRAAIERLRTNLEQHVTAEKQSERERHEQGAQKVAAGGVNVADSMALVSLYTSTSGPSSWLSKTNWLTGWVNTWYGITVTGDRVTHVRLPSNKLKGTIPSTLGGLDSLKVLNLGIGFFSDEENNNKLSGSIPKSLGDLTKLELLWLDGNELTGEIPSSLGDLENLESLDLGNLFGGNQLTGGIPESLGDLSKLERLSLGFNMLSGVIPATLGNLTALDNLDLGGNMLSGPIPESLGNLQNLTGLNLGTYFGGNQLTGTIPPSLGSLQKLEYLYLSNNELEGSIPTTLGQLTQLGTLSLGGNKLTGSILIELGNLTNLEHLDLGVFLSGDDGTGNTITFDHPNYLDGEIPTQLGNLVLLESLSLGNNRFSGPVPASLANLDMLGTLMLNCNQLEELPSLSAISVLDDLFVENNALTFGDIVPNAGVPSNSFTYAPQAPVSVTTSVAGSNFVLSVDHDQSGNQYQWYRFGSPIGGATQSSYSFPTSDPDGPSAYYVEIANPGAPDLTLSSVSVPTNIIVNQSGDASDAELADGVCDTDSQTTGSQCTLRAAIETVNEGGAQTCGASTVQILFAGVPLIQPTSPLPAVRKTVVIDGNMGGGRVELRGNLAGGADGLVLEGEGILVRNMTINAFNRWGIRVSGGSDHGIQASRIGVLADERTNGSGAILVEGGTRGVTIGGLVPVQENIIGGEIHITDAGTQGIRVLRNTMELLDPGPSPTRVFVPIDLGGDGPTCSSWSTDRVDRPNLEVPAPRVLELTPTFVRGMTRAGATVVAYLVSESGAGLGRYWARKLTPIGSGSADGTGQFIVSFDFPLAAGEQISLTMTDAGGSTSELSQVRRPVIYLPGVGGSWLQGRDSDWLFLPPAGKPDYITRRRLDRLAMDESGQTNLSGETITVKGILELPGLYADVLARLESEGFVGHSENFNQSTLDLWRFPYDWRLNPSDVAADLQSLVNNITSLTEDVAAACEVDIVTHSNGGMVASAYVWNAREHSQDHVNTLLMNAAPYWGTPQVAAAHTRGYLFGVESILHLTLDWGRLVRVFQNLPDGYGLLPSRAYMAGINPDAPQQNDWYLTDLYARPLHGYQETFDFMTAPKLDPDDLDQDNNAAALGLARNGPMWAAIQSSLHDKMNDWRTYQGPPHVFRHVGRQPLSTPTAWRVPPSFDPERPEGSWRVDVGDTDRHVAYREAILPRMGWGDGTVALVSATLGAGETRGGIKVGLPGFDYSGNTESTWIGTFEYFDCDHLGMVSKSCVDDDKGGTVNVLQRMVDVLKSSYQIIEPGSGKLGNQTAQDAAEANVFYITASGPARVIIEDDSGLRTGPTDPESINSVEYGLADVGYWASSRGATVSIPTSAAYDLIISSDDEPITIRVTRVASDNDQTINVLFEDQELAAGGNLHFGLTEGGTVSSASFDLDADGDGGFEGVLEPAAVATSTGAGTAMPEPYPIVLNVDIMSGAPDPHLDLTIPEASSSGWSWALEDVPTWVSPSAISGQGSATIDITLLASTLTTGVYRDTMTTVLNYQGYTARTKLPVELAVRDQSATLQSITVYQDKQQVAIGDSLTAWATGTDHLGISIPVQVTWNATGGLIDANGVYIAGAMPGIYAITATSSGGQITGSADVEIVGSVATESAGELPERMELLQNYPNPFNPTTIIPFAVAKSEHVRLEIFDLLGRSVAVAIDETISTGRYEFRFDAARLSSGIYIYRLTAGEIVTMRKMILLR